MASGIGMTIFTDGVHLVSDSSVDELHDFAQRIGLKREWFQDKPRSPHYDMTVRWRAKRAEDHGATKVSMTELIMALRRLRTAERRMSE